MNKYITIDGRKIGRDYSPYIIAELSANHNGDIEKAFELMKRAKLAGADAIKIQTYRPDTITIECDSKDFQIYDGLWNGRSLYELYEWAHTPWEWHDALFEKAKELNITIFSSPFDDTAVDLLEELEAPAYKIASFEIVDLPLIKKVALTGKPMIISTGMANEVEIQDAINTALDNGCSELAILHCVSGYPAPANEYNLKTIEDLDEKFKCIAGLSDHTVDNATAIASIPMGACIIEKHFTLDRNGGGPDDSFSIEPEELHELIKSTRRAWEAIGVVNYERTEAERGNVKFRRSLYIVEDIKSGETFNISNVKSIRPGYGISPKYYESVLGRKAKTDIPRGTALDWNLIE